MTPDAFAARFPRLYRLSAKGSEASIRRHGLLTARSLARLAGHDLPDSRRAKSLPLTLPDGTSVQITDNSPLSLKRLAGVLDDGLTPVGWMAMLNTRVFFWPSETHGHGNLRARTRFGYASEWHVFDTAALLTPAWDRAEIAPFNTGATIHVPPRRGHATFAPLLDLDFENWRRRRRDAGTIKGLDAVAEITVRGNLDHASDALVAVNPA